MTLPFWKQRDRFRALSLKTRAQSESSSCLFEFCCISFERKCLACTAESSRKWRVMTHVGARQDRSGARFLVPPPSSRFFRVVRKFGAGILFVNILNATRRCDGLRRGATDSVRTRQPRRRGRSEELRCSFNDTSHAIPAMT